MHKQILNYISRCEAFNSQAHNRPVVVAGALLTVLGLGVMAPAPAAAQISPVTVDLSVLDNNYGSYGNSNSGGAPTFSGNDNRGQLLMPGAANPLSKYYGPALSNEVLNSIVPVMPSSNAGSNSSSINTTLTSADTVAAPEPVAMPEAPAVAVSQPVEEPVANQTVALEPQAAPAVPEAPPALPEAVSETAPDATTQTPEQEPQVAALTPAPASLKPGRAMQLLYTSADDNIPASGEAGLKDVAEAIKANDGFRIQLMAFAGENGLTSSKARRLSLSRALSVRSFFIGQGVRSTRIDVRALGDKTDEAPLNRVDINITER